MSTFSRLVSVVRPLLGAVAGTVANGLQGSGASSAGSADGSGAPKTGSKGGETTLFRNGTSDHNCFRKGTSGTHRFAGVFRNRTSGYAGLAVLGVLAVTLLDASPAAALQKHSFSFAFGSGGSGAGQVSLAPLNGSGEYGSGVAVNDATGNIYVADTGNSRVDEFDSSGNFVRAWGWGVADGASSFETCTTTCRAGISGSGAGQFETPNFIAVDNSGGPSAGDVYVGDSGDQLVTKFDASGNLITSWGDGGGATCGTANGQLSGACATGGPFPRPMNVGITVDMSGNLFVGTNSGQQWFEFAQNGAPITTTSLSLSSGFVNPSQGIGVDGNGNLYEIGGFTQVVQFGPSGGEVGAVTPPTFSATGLVVDPLTNDVYADLTGNQGSTIWHIDGASLPTCVPSASCAAGEQFGQGDLSGATGLAFDPATGTVYAADTGNSRIAVFSPSPPSIDATSVTNLTSSSADLNAEIDPNGFDTTYHIEWGTSTSYGNSVPVPDGDLGSGTNDVPITQHIDGLSANTTYHWRVVLTSSRGTTAGPDHTFIYETGGQGLPDGRAYEQVTPVQKNGALIAGGFSAAMYDISDDGSRVIMATIQCFGSTGSCTGARFEDGEPYEFNRTGSGWQPTPLAPPSGGRYGTNTSLSVNANLGTALFSISTPPGGEDDWYARSADGSFSDIGPVSPPASGALGVAPYAVQNTIMAPGDLSHVVWNSFPVWPFDSTISGSEDSAYQYAGTGNSQPVLVGVSGGEGSTDLISTCATTVGPGSGPTLGAVSATGSTVFFTAYTCSTGSGANAGTPVPADTLYARVDGTLPDAHTVLISGRSPADCTTAACQGSPPGDAHMVGASADGSKVLFESTQQLTDDASEDSHSGDTAGGGACAQTTGVNGCNLYLYDFANPAGHELVDVSAGDSSGGGPRVRGVEAMTGDGSHVYFVAQGVLTSVPNAQGQTAQDGANNLYVYERDASFPAGHLAFIAQLPSSDQPQWSVLPWANVTPDGRFLVFASHGQLTADDSSSGAWYQVFRYDAQTGQLIRISTSNSGFNDSGNSGSGDATIVPGLIHLFNNGYPRLDPTMSDDGSFVFFQSPIALTPNALNDVPVDSAGDLAQNVYEWHNGQVSLISDGRDATSTQFTPCNVDGRPTGSSVCLLGTDTSGANVFFTTADQLVPQDTDTALDIYDARIGGGFPYTPAVGCSGDTCQGSPGTAPSVPVAATVSFTGPGNPSPAAARRPPARVRVVKRAVKGSSFIVTVVVAGRGRITITGAGVRTLHRSVARAGSYRLRVTLTPKEKRLLKRKRRLRLGLRVSYQPVGAPASHVSFSILDRA